MRTGFSSTVRDMLDIPDAPAGRSRCNGRRRRRSLAASRSAAVGLVLLLALPAGAGAQERAADLYACAGEPRDAGEPLGLTLCDGQPAPELLARAAEDNLQIRDGALVTAAAADAIAGIAGLQAGDLIYRVGGADVPDAGTAVERLGRIGPRADTVVNFLRGGRPYRVKLRR